MNSNTTLKAVRPSRRLVYIGLPLLFIVVSVMAALGIWQLHSMAHSRMHTTVQSMVVTLDKSIEGMVATIDLTLQASAHGLGELHEQRKLNPANAAALLGLHQKNVPLVDWLHATNARGDVVFGSSLVSPPIYIGDRDYFKALRDDPQAGMYISKAFRSRRADREIWQFARRYNDAQGRFAGIVIAPVSISTLQQMLSQLAMDPGGVATIRDADMGMIVRHTFGQENPITFGDRTLSAPFSEALQSNPKEGIFESGSTSIDGVNRTQAYRRNARYAFVSVVGIGEDYAYAEWRSQAWMVAALITLLGALSFVFGRMTLRAWTRIEKDFTQIERSNARFRAVIESSPVPIALNNENLQITYVNQAFTRTFGYVQEDIPTLQDWWEKAYPDVRYREQIALTWQEHLKASEASGFAFEPVEARIRCKNGEERIVLAVAAPLSETFQDTHVVALSDMTEHMQSQAALRELNATLDQRVTQRTLELADALQRAELASRSRGAFLANMSHEIRTPMNSVLGMAYLALKADPPERVRAYLEKIQIAGKHLLGIISDILDFSKIDAGKLELDVTHFEPRRLVADVVQLCEGRAREKGLDLEWSVADDVPQYLQGDPVRLGQILINYLNNAIKFTSQGAISLHNSVEPSDGTSDPSHCMLRWRVTDSGIGMSTEQAARMFQSFEQADNSTSRRFGGTGLGLAICKQLALRMGGNVGVHSVLGQGSSFWFSASLQMPTETPPVPGAAPIAHPEAELSGMHILVVDDNSFNLEVAQGILEGVGVRVATAPDAHTALAELEHGRFDCVLMDVQMPGMDGLEATRQIRADSTMAHTVVVGLTANATRASQRQCREAGMQAVVTKPIDPQKLFATLSRVLRAAQQSGGVNEPDPMLIDTAPSPLESEAPSGADAIWDLQALVDCVGDNPAVHERLIRHFLESARQVLATLQSALQSQKPDQLRMCAHNLKSSARTVGAMELSAACARLENADPTTSMAEFETLTNDILHRFAAAEKAMLAAVTTNESPATSTP